MLKFLHVVLYLEHAYSEKIGTAMVSILFSVVILNYTFDISKLLKLFNTPNPHGSTILQYRTVM